jgi:hypothetical protein
MPIRVNGIEMSNLKDKIMEWMSLREEASALQKAAKEASKPIPSMPAKEPHLTATGFLPKPFKPKLKIPPMKKVQVSPAMTSAPLVVNRVDSNRPKEIDQPNVINPYKEIFSSLQKRKGK